MYSLPINKYLLGKEFIVIQKLTIINDGEQALIQEYTFEERYKQWVSVLYINEKPITKTIKNQKHVDYLRKVFPLNEKPKTIHEIKKYIGVNDVCQN